MKNKINESFNLLGNDFTKKKELKCDSFFHNPPSNLYIPIGGEYKHKCLACGNTIIVKN